MFCCCWLFIVILMCNVYRTLALYLADSSESRRLELVSVSSLPLGLLTGMLCCYCYCSCYLWWWRWCCCCCFCFLRVYVVWTIWQELDFTGYVLCDPFVLVDWMCDDWLTRTSCHHFSHLLQAFMSLTKKALLYNTVNKSNCGASCLQNIEENNIFMKHSVYGAS